MIDNCEKASTPQDHVNMHHTNRTGVGGLLLATLLTLCTTAVLQAKGQYAVSYDGVRIFYEPVGQGTPIFLIAGGPGSSSDTLRFTHSLLKSVGQIVYIDNRGRGRSHAPASPKAYTLENDVKDVEAVRKAMKVDKIIIYGHSYGSMVALSYAVDYPQHTLAVITTGGVHGARVWQERNIDVVKIIMQRQYPKKWKQIVQLHKQGVLTGDPEVQKLFDVGYVDFYLFNPESRWRLYPQFPRPKNNVNLYNVDVYLAMAGPDPEWVLGGTIKNVELLPKLSRFKGPALIMGGRHDLIAPVLNQMEIADALPHAKLVIFEQSSHLPFEEEPLRFLSVVEDFIQGVTKQ